MQLLKIPINAISRINFICKKEKVLKALKFGDRINITTSNTNIIGVNREEPNSNELYDLPS